MNITDKERTEFLETLAREQYPQGDDYYAYKGKQDLWHFGYTNDYPLQHGKGEKSTIHNKIVNTLISRRNKVENLLISGVAQQRELFFSLMDFMKSQSRVSMMSHGMHEELWNEFKEKYSG